jgi:hypothetical protein
VLPVTGLSCPGAPPAPPEAQGGAGWRVVAALASYGRDHKSRRTPTRAGRGRVGAQGRWPRSSPPPPQRPGGRSAATTAGWCGGSWPSAAAGSHPAQPDGCAEWRYWCRVHPPEAWRSSASARRQLRRPRPVSGSGRPWPEPGQGLDAGRPGTAAHGCARRSAAAAAGPSRSGSAASRGRRPWSGPARA